MPLLYRILKDKPMEQVNLRLPVGIRAKARKVAQECSTEGNAVRESDVYRTAIALFFESNFTDSKDEAGIAS